MKIVLNFLKLIHIHPILVIFIFISFITGTFTQLFLIFLIVIIHEAGHYLAASLYKWRIYSIVLWIFGGVMKTDESNNRKIKEDIIVTIAGPLQHIFIFLLLLSFDYLNILPKSVISQGHYYNAMILLFNLLPIYPLDGGKLLFYFLSTIVPFRKAHQFTIVFSFLSCFSLILVQIIFFPFTLSAFLLISFLIFENWTEWRNKYYTFMRFLLNRLNHPLECNKSEILIISDECRLIDVFKQFRRNRIHELQIAESEYILSENKCLRLYFKEKKVMETIGEIIREP
ncbi:M50 family metallopeptidase [Pseudogracilibacillus sp. SE30717A]|uniref:M50 family metallopeptidase n=1 Tax=Pseudogracilibacillus sp. SE30717A TaxID=3098293 RepID=UPI00300DBEE3